MHFFDAQANERSSIFATGNPYREIFGGRRYSQAETEFFGVVQPEATLERDLEIDRELNVGPVRIRKLGLRHRAAPTGDAVLVRGGTAHPAMLCGNSDSGVLETARAVRHQATFRVLRDDCRS